MDSCLPVVKTFAYALVLNQFKERGPEQDRRASHWTSQAYESYVKEPNPSAGSCSKAWSKLSLLFERRISESDPDRILISGNCSLLCPDFFGALQSCPTPPPWSWRLFGSGVEFIHGLKLVQIAMCSDENSVPKDLLKYLISVFASLPVSHQALFFNTLCNLILEPIQRKSHKNDGKLSKNHGPAIGHLFCIF